MRQRRYLEERTGWWLPPAAVSGWRRRRRVLLLGERGGRGRRRSRERGGAGAHEVSDWLRRHRSGREQGAGRGRPSESEGKAVGFGMATAAAGRGRASRSGTMRSVAGWLRRRLKEVGGGGGGDRGMMTAAAEVQDKQVVAGRGPPLPGRVVESEDSRGYARYCTNMSTAWTIAGGLRFETRSVATMPTSLRPCRQRAGSGA